MNTLSHEQAIQYLHEATQYLSVDQQSDLAAHLAECKQCRAYADQLAALQPRLRHALHTRSYAHLPSSADILQDILQHKRRNTMRKRMIAMLGIVVAAVVALMAVLSTKIPSQFMTGAQLAATAIPTMGPSPAPTMRPTATPLSSPLSTVNPFQSPLLAAGADRFEPNESLDAAAQIDVNVRYDQLNFASITPNADGWKWDYFKVHVKPGMSLTCHTLDPSPGTDTSLILFNDTSRFIGGDDGALTKNDLTSSVAYTVTYEGWLYVLVGQSALSTFDEAQKSTYSLECSANK